MDARVPEDNVDICRLAQNSRSVTHHAQAMTCKSDTLEARPVREQSGGGQWACQVAGHAADLQPSSGRGRLRRREEARRRFDSVRKRVNGGFYVTATLGDMGRVEPCQAKPSMCMYAVLFVCHLSGHVA